VATINVSPQNQSPVTTPARRLIGVVAACVVPGLGHIACRRGKGLVFLATISGMWVVGLTCGGRLFPLRSSDLLATFYGLAERMVGLPFVIARLAGFGPGRITSITAEYGDAFLITAGLLNALIVLDAWDVASGRK
jgi:hypothetical protein